MMIYIIYIKTADDIYYVHQDCRTKGCRKKILLLPSYDEYLIGYKSRHHAIAEQFCRQAYNKNGIFTLSLCRMVKS